MLKPFITYSGDSHATSKPRQDIPTYASSDQLNNAEGGAVGREDLKSLATAKALKGKTGKKMN